ncbi:unnamed protein product [Rangifer tarandus platyrhynchus]|uniref:Uncharacterized protein n=1 Tax=Rangifer tarandus platyrhynchus TaxID=3082113 RepID=A0ABN8YW43_RANTA|nr:unnamed protein product [Rangifer tarandus platyrhynchus]
MKAKVLESRKVVMGPWARPVRPRAKGQMSSCSGAFGCPVNRGLSELQPAWLTWPAVESQGPGARVCVFLHIRALQRSPRHLSVQDPVLEAVNTGWSAAAGPRLPDPGVAPFVRPQWARPAARPRLIGARAAAATPAPPRTWAPAGPRTPDLGTPARIRSRRALGHWAPDPDPCSDPDPCLPDPPQTGSKTPSHVDPATAPLPTRCGPQAPDIEPPAGPGPAWRRRTRPPSLQGHADPPGGE